MRIFDALLAADNKVRLISRVHRSDARFCIGCPCFCAESMAGRHTIILLQPSHSRATRTFMDFDSVNQALDGICGLYENKIRHINPVLRTIVYDITDLYNFIDGQTDISALVYDDALGAFLPFDREWIKQRMFQRLKQLAQQ